MITCTLQGSDLMFCLEEPNKKGDNCASNLYICLVSFGFSFYKLATLCIVSGHEQHHYHFNLQQKKWSAIQNTLGYPLNISSSFLWNLSPAKAAPKSHLTYLYLSNWYTNVLKYNDFSSHFRSWYNLQHRSMNKQQEIIGQLWLHYQPFSHIKQDWKNSNQKSK